MPAARRWCPSWSCSGRGRACRARSSAGLAGCRSAGRDRRWWCVVGAAVVVPVRVVDVRSWWCRSSSCPWRWSSCRGGRQRPRRRRRAASCRVIEVSLAGSVVVGVVVVSAVVVVEGFVCRRGVGRCGGSARPWWSSRGVVAVAAVVSALEPRRAVVASSRGRPAAGEPLRRARCPRACAWLVVADVAAVAGTRAAHAEDCASEPDGQCGRADCLAAMSLGGSSFGPFHVRLPVSCSRLVCMLCAASALRAYFDKCPIELEPGSENFSTGRSKP